MEAVLLMRIASKTVATPLNSDILNFEQNGLCEQVRHCAWAVPYIH